MRFPSLTHGMPAFADALRTRPTARPKVITEPTPLTVQTREQRAAFITTHLQHLEDSSQAPTHIASGSAREKATLAAAQSLLLALADELSLAVVIGRECVSKRKIVPAVALARLNVAGSDGIALHDGIIAVKKTHDGYRQTRLLAHEISHHLLGHTQWRVEKHLMVRREIEAESLAYLLLSRLEISQRDVSSDYVQGYADSHEDGLGQRTEALHKMTPFIEPSLVLLDNLISSPTAG